MKELQAEPVDELLLGRDMQCTLEKMNKEDVIDQQVTIQQN